MCLTWFKYEYLAFSSFLFLVLLCLSADIFPGGKSSLNILLSYQGQFQVSSMQIFQFDWLSNISYMYIIIWHENGWELESDGEHAILASAEMIIT